MEYQTIFKRYEIKYLLTLEQQERICKAMEPYMEMDKYGHTTIRNLYFDTDSYRLIRRSIEKPVYKEKLRIRSYRLADETTPVFVELKKKYRSTVYKRRLQLPYRQAMDWLAGCGCPVQNQISREIDYFLHFYGDLAPRVFLSYDRQAFYSRDGSNFRVTFDDNVLCRQEDISLHAPPGGKPLLPPGKVLMELKTPGAIPLWMTRLLTEEKLYKASFSKYGTAYQTTIFQGGNRND